MNRSQLRAQVAAAASLSKSDADAALDAILSAIADAIARGETVAIAGFGKFTTRQRAAAEIHKPEILSPSPPAGCPCSRLARPFATRSTNRVAGAVVRYRSVVRAAPPERARPRAIDARRCAGHRARLLPRRFRPHERRTGARGHLRPTIPFMPWAFGPASTRWRRGFGTFGAGRRRGEIFDPPRMRTCAQSHAAIGFLP